MPKIKEYKVDGKPEDFRKYFFHCPGCDEIHAFTSEWKFNKNIENPTVSPSILVTWGPLNPGKRCHSYIKEGKIQFLNDCHHELKGKTIDLPECNY